MSGNENPSQGSQVFGQNPLREMSSEGLPPGPELEPPENLKRGTSEKSCGIIVKRPGEAVRQ